MLGKAETPAQTPASFVLSHQALVEKVGCCSTSLSARSGVLVGKITITDMEEVVFLQKSISAVLNKANRSYQGHAVVWEV